MSTPPPAPTAIENDAGGYAFVPGIEPYSGGVRSLNRFEIVHVTFRTAPAWQDGFVAIDAMLADLDRPAAALCSVELRCPRPHSFDGFIEFNGEYRSALDQRGLLLGDTNPVARTNVSPVGNGLDTTVMHGFGFTQESEGTADEEASPAPSFVIAGAGDLRDQSELAPAAIVAGAESWQESGPQRATVVLEEMEARMTALGVSWTDASIIDVYTAQPLHSVLGSTVLPRLGPAADLGVHWFLSHPPIVGLAFEMDLRGGTRERLI